MSNLVAVIVNIVSSLIFFVLGYLLRSLTRAASRARLARQWGMPLVGKVGIYVGARESVVEPTGDMGVGDAFALQEMGQYLDKVGVPYDLIYIRVALKQEPDGNLILLGGPDANVLTKNALEHIKPGLHVISKDEHAFRPGMKFSPIQDIVNDAVYEAEITGGSRVAGRGIVKNPLKATKDYGVVISAPSPYGHGRIIMVYGAYGYGTWGAVRWLKSARIPEEIRDSAGGFECLLPVDVVGYQAIPGKPCVLRAIPASGEILSSWWRDRILGRDSASRLRFFSRRAWRAVVSACRADARYVEGRVVHGGVRG